MSRTVLRPSVTNRAERHRAAAVSERRACRGSGRPRARSARRTRRGRGCRRAGSATASVGQSGVALRHRARRAAERRAGPTARGEGVGSGVGSGSGADGGPGSSATETSPASERPWRNAKSDPNATSVGAVAIDVPDRGDGTPEALAAGLPVDPRAGRRDHERARGVGGVRPERGRCRAPARSDRRRRGRSSPSPRSARRPGRRRTRPRPRHRSRRRRRRRSRPRRSRSSRRSRPGSGSRRRRVPRCRGACRPRACGGAVDRRRPRPSSPPPCCRHRSPGRPARRR